MSMIGSILKINPLTHKAKNRINEGLGKLVVVVAETEECQCLGNVPAIMIAPQGEGIISEHSRWIKPEGDKDFLIVATY